MITQSKILKHLKIQQIQYAHILLINECQQIGQICKVISRITAANQVLIYKFHRRFFRLTLNLRKTLNLNFNDCTLNILLNFY